MTILLTGATGFVGSHILDVLLKRGLKVKVISRPTSTAKLASWSNIEEIVLTDNLFLENQEWLCSALSGVDTIIHASWYAEPGQYLSSDLNLECLTGTILLAKAASLVGVKKFVGVGTCFEYKESQEPLSIDCQLSPTTLYASSKSACFSVLSKFFEDKTTRFAWARLFYLYGDREDNRRLVPYLRDRLSQGKIAELTTGEQIRDFIDVAKAAEVLVDVACGDLTGPINVCSGNPVSVKELALSISKEYDAEECLHFGARPPNLTDPAYVVGVPNYK
jgi:nucleoside-diphosphate-sugar epimerase